MKQHLRNFDNWKLNESYQDMGANPTNGSADVVRALISEVDKAVQLDNWREANRILRVFIKNNEKALAQADGTEVLTALEPWYDTYNKDWEADANEFQDDDPLSQEIEDDSFEFSDDEPSTNDDGEAPLAPEETEDWE